MRTCRWLIASVAFTIALLGCTPNEAFRKVGAIPAVACKADSPAALPDACRRAITETTADYDLHFVEFDDQGWTYPDAALIGHDPGDESSQQLRLVIERLKAAEEKQPVRVFVFIHGWKHNAAFDDENVVNFRNFLKEAAQYEDVAQSGNRVVGIYAAWRGKSLDLSEPWISVTFWDRKTVAQHVAVGSIRELTAQLRAFQRHANGVAAGTNQRFALPNDQRVRIFMIGHSFGGLALYAAVSQALVNGLVSGEDVDGKLAPVERLADMVVLINPAFEATRYQPLDRAARNRTYDIYQSPIFVSVTSDADQATGKLFPLGRTLNTLWESELTKEEKDANRNTPGHIDAYLTHRLDLTGTSTAACAGWKPEPTTASEMAENIQLEFKNSQVFNAEMRDERWPMDGTGKPFSRIFCGGLVLTPLGGQPAPFRNPDPNMPLWNVTVTGDIIPDHNDINRPIFRAFLRQLFLDEYFNAGIRARMQTPVQQLPK